MTFKIVTWNINSVRLRLKNALRLLVSEAPDVLCLQEIKATEDAVPRAAFATAGYAHAAIRGQAGYHGVAIFARMPFRKIWSDSFCTTNEARHIAVTLANGLELHNFYVPAGGDVPDSKANPKFAHKLGFLESMARHFGAQRNKMRAPRILVGDLNVAPLEHDVWSHKQLLDVVSHTPAEVERLLAIRDSHGFLDVSRHAIPEPVKLYTWWSYRARDWEASDRGRRLDHIWLSPALTGALSATSVLKPVRGWPEPSDHVPVTVTLDV